MFGLVVRFTCKDQLHAAQFDRLTAATVAEIVEHEPGTLLYTTHRVGGRPLERVFYELYEDRAAFEVHERQPHVTAFLSEREQHLTDVEVDFLDLLTGKGINE